MNKQRRIGSFPIFIVVFLFQVSTIRSQLVCQTSDRPQVVEFLLEDPVPLVAPLDKGFPIGSSLSLEGSVPPDAYSFSVELLVPEDVTFMEQPPMALSFRARFNMDQVFHNSFLKRTWGQQEVPYWFSVSPGDEFNITFEAVDKGFKIDVDGTLFWMYFNRVDSAKVSHVRVSGDVTLHKLTYHVGSQKTCRPSSNLRAQELVISGAVPYTSQLHHPFSTGSVLSVSGTLHRNADWMAINLQSDGDVEEVIVLQLKAKLRLGTVVQNTFFNGVWGWDYSNDTLPLERGSNFNIDFHSDDRHIKVCVNGALFSRYEHRLNPERVTLVSVNGAVTLKSVLHYTNGTHGDSPHLPFKTCSPLGATPSFKNILCELCSRLPGPDISIMTTGTDKKG